MTKCLIVDNDDQRENTSLDESIQAAASAMHLIFMTDTGRRTRFASLNVLSYILSIGQIRDLKLSSRPNPTTFAVESVSLEESRFFSYCSDTLTAQERIVLYFIRLAGISFAPHLQPCSVISESSISSEFVDAGDEDLARFAVFTPSIMSCKDILVAQNEHASNSQQSVPTEESQSLFNTAIDKVASKESLRIESCNHVIRLLCQLANAPIWNGAISSILNRILDAFLLPNRDRTTEISSSLRIDMIGASLLLGGGSAGKYLGAKVQNFFGNSNSVVLNINNTTNYATLLSWNMVGNAQQITRVRLGDITVVASSADGDDNCLDRLCLSKNGNKALARELLPRLFGSLTALGEFAPLLINDFLSVIVPDHPYQCKSLLRSLRPVELLLFSQFLKTLASIQSAVLLELGAAEWVKANSSFAKLIQQTASSTLCIPSPSGSSNSITYGGGAQSCANSCGNYCANSGIVSVDAAEENGLFSLWMKSSKYVLSLPNKLGYFPLIANSDIEKLLYDFASQCYGIAVESLVNTPFETLLRRGRLSELIHCLAVGSASLLGVPLPKEISSDFLDDKYLMSDWSAEQPNRLNGSKVQSTENKVPSFFFYLTAGFSGANNASGYSLINSTDAEQHQQEAANALRLLFHLRESIVRNSRHILQLNDFMFDLQSIATNETAWNIVILESVLPLSVSINSNCALPLLYGFYDEVCARIQFHGNKSFNTESAWRRIANVFRLNNRIEVTQSIASTLRYSALSLLQTSSIKSMDNVLETADLFKKIVQTTFHWLDFNQGHPKEEEVHYHVLKIILPSLSFIDSSVIELQLMQICTYTIRKLVLCLYDGYCPSKELLDLAKNNNFTLLRARAQEQVIKFKCHGMGSVSPLAYNLTQIVTGLEIIQRYGCTFESSRILTTIATESSSENFIVSPASTAETRLVTPRRLSSKSGMAAFAAKLATKESAPPKIIGIRSTSIDADLNNCVLSALRAISSEIGNLNGGNWKGSDIILSNFYNPDSSVILVEVAMAVVASPSQNRFSF